MRKRLVALFGLAVAIVMVVTACSGASDVIAFDGKHKAEWNLTAAKPLLIGGYGDNFNYDGTKVVPLDGEATVMVNTKKDTGTIELIVNGTVTPEKGMTYTGEIKIVYDIATDGSAFQEGGVADFIYLHGDTGQGPPVMPKVRTFVAAWGPADVYVNGELVYEGLDGHMMYTERSRDTTTRAIYKRDRTAPYSPMDPTNYSIAAPTEREMHFVAHTEIEDPDNFPAHTVWFHFNFEQVTEN